jgi:thiamine thiazole synthase
MTRFASISEKTITSAMTRAFLEDLQEYADSDVIIIGGGPSGLRAAIETARAGLKTLIVERNNYLGGGFWIGGYLMNKLTFRAPAQEELETLGIPYREAAPGLFLTDGPAACSKLIAAACDAGAHILNMTQLDDVVLRGGRVEGAVLNWSPVSQLPRQISCVDPVAFEGRLLLDATGHEALAVRALERRGLMKVPGEGAMHVEASEDAVVERTGEVFPGLMVSGMAVAAVHGLPRMGPTFGGMLLSGRKAGKLAVRMLGRDRETQVAAG